MLSDGVKEGKEINTNSQLALAVGTLSTPAGSHTDCCHCCGRVNFSPKVLLADQNQTKD